MIYLFEKQILLKKESLNVPMVSMSKS